MKRRRSNVSTSSVGDRIVDGNKPALGLKFALEDEALECPRSFIDKHFFSSDGRQETEDKEIKVVVLRHLFEEERQCLDKAAERRGLQTTSIGSRRRNWTLIIGHHAEAVCHEVEELCWKETEQASTVEKGKKPIAALSLEEHERKQEEAKEAKEREVFLEEWRRQRKVNNIKVKDEHEAFVKTIGQTGSKYGVAGEWRLYYADFTHYLPESSPTFDLTISFADQEHGELFGSFDFGVLKGLLRVQDEDFGSGYPAVDDWKGPGTGGYIHHSNFQWRARDTKGYLQEGEGHLSMVIGSFTRMKGVLISTSLPSSPSSVIAYDFEAFQVSSNPSPSLFSSWRKMSKKGSRFDYENESDLESKDGHSDDHWDTDTRSDNYPRSDRSRKSRHELEDYVQHLKTEIRKLVDEKVSTVEAMECKLLAIYSHHAKEFHEHNHRQVILSEKQAAEIASLKLAVIGHDDGHSSNGKNRRTSEQFIDQNRETCVEKVRDRPKGKRPG